MCAAAEASYVTAAAAASAMCGAAPTMCAATAPAMCAAAETSDARRNRYVLADEANIGFKVHPHTGFNLNPKAIGVLKLSLMTTRPRLSVPAGDFGLNRRAWVASCNLIGQLVAAGMPEYVARSQSHIRPREA
jgi:hypothetical protein